MSTYFGAADLETLVPLGIHRAQALRSKLVAPTVSERCEVRNMIAEFIRDRKCIVYGGIALDLHLEAVGSPDRIYTTDSAEPDIEFYSPNAMSDIVDLCDRLREKCENVDAKLAMHDDTYTIFVDFQKYCDVTYMPRNLFLAIPFDVIHGMRCVSPSFACIDVLRALSDPLTSYFRLEKDVSRMQILARNFPFPRPGAFSDTVISVPDTKNVPGLVGRDAYLYYCHLAGVPPVVEAMEPAPVEFWTADLSQTAHDLLQIYGPDAKYTEHHRFFDYLGRSGRIAVHGKTVAIAYATEHRAIPCISETGPASFAAVLCHLMITKVQADVLRDRETSHRKAAMVCHMMHMRESMPPSAFVEGPFAEFVCQFFVGTAMGPMHVKEQRQKERERKKRRIVFRYRPGITSKDFLDVHSFDNTSGNIVNNKRDYVYKRYKGDSAEATTEHDADIDARRTGTPP